MADSGGQTVRRRGYNISMLRTCCSPSLPSVSHKFGAVTPGPPLPSEAVVCPASEAAETLRRLRQQQGLSQGEVAARATVRQASVSAFETGRSETVTLETLEQYAAAVGYDVRVAFLHRADA